MVCIWIVTLDFYAAVFRVLVGVWMIFLRGWKGRRLENALGLGLDRKGGGEGRSCWWDVGGWQGPDLFWGVFFVLERGVDVSMDLDMGRGVFGEEEEVASML